MACLMHGAVAQSQPASGPPNIIMILIDDLGQRDIGPYGSTFHPTPALDRLAATGMLFTDGYAACNVCSPTRAAVQTGKHPARLKLTNFLKGVKSPPDAPLITAAYADQLDLEETTVAEALKTRGYATAHIGKWHLGSDDYSPEKQGYDLNIAGHHYGTPPSYFYPYKNKTGSLPELEQGGKEGEYLTDRLTDEAIRFIEAKKDSLFFLNLCHYSVHTPIHPRPDLLAKHQAKAQAAPPTGPQRNAHYAAMVESMDQSVGRILDALDRLNIADRTLIVFTSDNGGLCTPEGPNTPATSNLPLRSGKGHHYEGGVRVPLIVRWPGVTPPGSRCAVPVYSVDFFPTFCQAAGVARPQTRGPIDGVSILPLLADPAAFPQRPLYWHYPHYSNQGGRPGGAIRLGDWKLIEHFETHQLELFNLADDPGELIDLSGKAPDKVRQLGALLRQWRTDVAANMPTPNPKYVPVVP
jgi:arylsulfatase A-like enzyme